MMLLPDFPGHIWTWPAFAVNVVDGDTVDILIDRGFRETRLERVRLYGVDTPERGQPGFREAGTALATMLFDITLTDAKPYPLVATTIKPNDPHDKYGRWLAKIATPTILNVADELIRLGLGVPYFGGSK
jgi:endonuclease YncB( thermonuclease family)